MEALSRQEISQAWEVVVVLDGQVDDSAALLEQYRSRLPLRVIVRPESAGVAAALSHGYAEARGAVIIRCDDDLTPAPDFVARHLAWHQGRDAEAPMLGVVSMTRDYFRKSTYSEAYGRPANERLLAAAYDRPPDQRWLHWAACNSVPKKAYEAAGGFDATMTYREDSELGYRLALSGVQIVLDPDLEIEHRGPALTVATRAARAFTAGSSTRALEARHPSLVSETATPTHGLWGRIVSAQALMLRSSNHAERFGRIVDRLLPLTPRMIRGKVVAWAVESAAVAGRRVGNGTWERPDISATPADVVLFVPGLAAGGGAEKTALVMAAAFRDLRLRVTCFTDGDVQPSWLRSHYGVDITSIEFKTLPILRLPKAVPNAVAELVRDALTVRYIKRTDPTLFVNIKYKSVLPGIGRHNWYFVHFPHRLAPDVESQVRRAYLVVVRWIRRLVLHPTTSSFVGTYDGFFANSNFTRAHVLDRWGVEAKTCYPPCNSDMSHRAGDQRARVILSVGRFQAQGHNVPHKNQHILVEAFSRMPDLIEDGWELHLVGALSKDAADREYFDHLSELARGLPVVLVANASNDQLESHMAKANLYWHAQGFGTDASKHPEAQEHFGISTVEAMSRGVVPLVYAQGGPLEIVTAVGSDLGWTSVSELVGQTHQLVTDVRLPDLREDCAHRARDFSTLAFTNRIQEEFAAIGHPYDTSRAPDGSPSRG